MRADLRFVVAEVLALAEYAITVEGHAGLVGYEPPGPALLPATDGAVLLCHGQPPLPPADGYPGDGHLTVGVARRRPGTRPGNPTAGR